MSKKTNDDMKKTIAAAISRYYPKAASDVEYAYDRLLSWDKTIAAIEVSLKSGLSLFDLVASGMKVLSVDKLDSRSGRK